MLALVALDPPTDRQHDDRPPAVVSLPVAGGPVRRTPAAVLIAQGMLWGQAAIWGFVALLSVPVVLLTAIQAEPIAVDDQAVVGAPLLRDQLVAAGLPLVFAALGALLANRLGRGRRWGWLGALVFHTGSGVGYGWFPYTLITAPSPEGMAAFSGVVTGPPLVLYCLAGVVTLLLPRVIRHLRAASPPATGAAPR
jgi:hypothetical protein